MSLAGAALAATRDDEFTRTARRFEQARDRYFARPSVGNYEKFVEARAAFLKAWGAEDAA